MPDKLVNVPVVEFVSHRKNGLHVGLALGVGFLSAGFILLIFFVKLMLSDSSSSTSSGFIGGLSVIPVFAFMYAIRLLKSATRVTVDASGVTLHGFASSKFIPFNHISSLKRKKQQGVESVDVVILCDGRGKALGQVSSILTGFPELVKLIETRSAEAVGHDTYERDKDLNERQQNDIKKNRRNGYILIAFASFALILGFWGGVEYYFKSQLENNATEIDAKISRHYMYNVTPRLEYSFKAEDGSEHSNDVMMEQDAWDKLKQAKNVRIKYLKSSPAWNSLVDTKSETGENFIMIILGVLGLLFFAPVGILALKGYDVMAENGKIYLRKAGELTDQFESEKKTQTPVAPPPIPQSGAVMPETAASPIPGQFEQPITPSIVPQEKTPGGIIAFGVINIIYGLLTLFVNLIRVAMAVLNDSETMSLGEMSFQFNGITLVVYAFFSSIIALGMLVSSVGLFKQKNWARGLAIFSGCGVIIMGFAGIALTLVPAVLDGMGDIEPDMKAPYVIGIIGSVILSLVWMIYPLVMVLVLKKREVRQRFK